MKKGWNNAELCNTGSLQTSFAIYRLVRQSTLSMYVTCHTCHHFMSSPTAKKCALQFCVSGHCQSSMWRLSEVCFS